MTRTGIAAVAVVVFIIFVVAAGVLVPRQPEPGQPFQGTWTASGTRHALAIGSAGRAAAIHRLSGAVVLDGGDGLAAGFHGELIAYDDGATLGVGRAVWVDARGDLIFSELRGEPVRTGRRITGTFTGGTGRYAGLSGQYAFTWRYLLEEDDGRVQGHSTALGGHYRLQRSGP